MTSSSKLEAYLAKLDKALGAIPVSEKAEIITEIKSHVLEAQARNDRKDLESILASLGEPEQVASRYLLERGLKPHKPPKHPIIKWLVIGFLGTLSIFVLFIIIMIWKFTPIIKVDEEKGHVAILGGLIDVNGSEGTIKVASTFNDYHKGKFNGNKTIDIKKTSELKILFNNGKFDLINSSDNQFTWDCKGILNKNNEFIIEDKKIMKVDLAQSGGVKCKFQIPSKLKTTLDGANGKIYLEKPHYDAKIKMSNGKVQIEPDEKQNYKYTFSVINGKIANFTNSKAKDAYNIEVALINGTIGKN